MQSTSNIQVKKFTKPFFLVSMVFCLVFCTFFLYSISYAKEKDDNKLKQEQLKVDLPQVDKPQIDESKKDQDKNNQSSKKEEPTSSKQENDITSEIKDKPKEKDDNNESKQEQPKIDLSQVEKPKPEESNSDRPKNDDSKNDKSKGNQENEHKPQIPGFVPGTIFTPLPVPIDPHSGSPPIIYIPPEIEATNNTTNNEGKPHEPKVEEPKGKPEEDTTQNDNESNEIPEITNTIPKEPKDKPEAPTINVTPNAEGKPTETPPTTTTEKPVEPLPVNTNGPIEPITTTPTTNENKCNCLDEEVDPSCEEICTEEKNIQTVSKEFPVEIPKGSTFVTSISIPNHEYRITPINKKADKIISVVLTDGNGNSFNVGNVIALQQSRLTDENNKPMRNTENQYLDLIIVATIPPSATSGEAKLTVSSDSKHIASISLKIADVKEVKIGKRKLGTPSIREPILAKLVKSNEGNFELQLKISGRNFVGKIAIIDGVLQKLINKASLFFTNITVAPDTGIKIKDYQIISTKEIRLTATIDSNITSGVKFFNIITPRGIDTFAIVFPETLTEGILEATTSLDGLINEEPVILED